VLTARDGVRIYRLAPRCNDKKRSENGKWLAVAIDLIGNPQGLCTESSESPWNRHKR
jgi:hypothetical protein